MLIIGLIIGFCLGIAVGLYCFGDTPIPNIKKYVGVVGSTSPEILIKDGHIKPISIEDSEYLGYSGGFVHITKCSHCGRTGRREEQLTYNPCVNCGNKIYDRSEDDIFKDKYTAKWIVL